MRIPIRITAIFLLAVLLVGISQAAFTPWNLSNGCYTYNTGSFGYKTTLMFNNTGTQTITIPGNVTSIWLQVIGGGGSGASSTGGGGDGGAIWNGSYVVVPGATYTFVVGQGGAYQTSPNSNGNNGSFSVWNTLSVGSGVPANASGGIGGQTAAINLSNFSGRKIAGYDDLTPASRAGNLGAGPTSSGGSNFSAGYTTSSFPTQATGGPSAPGINQTAMTGFFVNMSASGGGCIDLPTTGWVGGNDSFSSMATFIGGQGAKHSGASLLAATNGTPGTGSGGGGGTATASGAPYDFGGAGGNGSIIISFNTPLAQAQPLANITAGPAPLTVAFTDQMNGAGGNTFQWISTNLITGVATTVSTSQNPILAFGVGVYNVTEVITNTTSGQKIVATPLVINSGQRNTNVFLLHLNSAGFPDSSYYNNTITTVGSVGLNTTTVKFDGGSGFWNGNTGNYLQTANDSNFLFNFSQQPFTIVAWVNISSTPAVAYGIITTRNLTTTLGWVFFINPNRGINFGSINSTGTAFLVISSAGAIPLNNFTQVAVINNGTFFNLYVNGTLSNSTAFNAIPSGYITPESNDLYARVGTLYTSDSTTGVFNGNLDEIAVWNGVALPISALYPTSQTGSEFNASAFTPAPSFISNMSAGGPPLAVTLNDTSSQIYPVTSWQWFNKSNLTGNTVLMSTSSNLTNLFPKADNYTVFLAPGNLFGFSFNATGFFDTQIPTPAINCTPQQGLAGVLVSCINLGGLGNTSSITYNWSFGDNAGTMPYSNSSNLTVNHVYAYNGIFPVTLTVNNSFGTGISNTVYITISTSVPQQNTWYTPHQVRIAVIDQNQTKLPGMYICATVLGDSYPPGSNWNTNLYGLSSAAQSTMAPGSSMNSTSASDGEVTFTMMSSLHYSLLIQNASMGINQIADIYPIDSIYTVALTGSTPNNTYNSQGNRTQIYVTEPNFSYITVNYIYGDNAGLTSEVQFNFTFRGYPNNTEMFHKNFTSFGTTTVLANYTFKNIKGQQWEAYYNARRTQ